MKPKNLLTNLFKYIIKIKKNFCGEKKLSHFYLFILLINTSVLLAQNLSQNETNKQNNSGIKWDSELNRAFARQTNSLIDTEISKILEHKIIPNPVYWSDDKREIKLVINYPDDWVVRKGRMPPIVQTAESPMSSISCVVMIQKPSAEIIQLMRKYFTPTEMIEKEKELSSLCKSEADKKQFSENIANTQKKLFTKRFEKSDSVLSQISIYPSVSYMFCGVGEITGFPINSLGIVHAIFINDTFIGITLDHKSADINRSLDLSDPDVKKLQSLFFLISSSLLIDVK